jgi:hypothetical protein
MRHELQVGMPLVEQRDQQVLGSCLGRLDG